MTYNDILGVESKAIVSAVEYLSDKGINLPVSPGVGASQAQVQAAIDASNTATNVANIANASITTATPTIGQATVTAATPIQIHSGSVALYKGVTISALSSNTKTVYIGLTGVSSSTGFPLSAGSSANFNVNNINLLYIVSVSGDTSSVVGFSAS